MGRWSLTSSRRILQQRHVDGASGQVDVANDGAADKNVLDRALGGVQCQWLRPSPSLSRSGAEVETYEMWVLELVDDRDVIQLDVEVLVDALERPPDLDVVLQLHRHLVVDERLEEAMRFVSQRAGVIAWPGAPRIVSERRDKQT